MKFRSLLRCSTRGMFLLVFISTVDILATTNATANPSIIEVCDNALDDDQDGLIDLNDDDCECEVIASTSFIPNPSFEKQTCCPQRSGELNCAYSWLQASEASTDYIHTCDWLGWSNLLPPTPFPNGKGIMGFRDGRVVESISDPNWKEYAGACLLRPLEKDSTYRMEFFLGFINEKTSPPINITLFGTPDCKHLPFGGTDGTFGCPTNGPNWIELGAVFVKSDGDNSWVKAKLDVTPDVDIKAIAIGPECMKITSDVELYYFFDNLFLADINVFDIQIREELQSCPEDLIIEVPSNEAYSYQWYKDGVALIDKNEAELELIYGDGEYQVVVNDGISCKVTERYNYVNPVDPIVKGVSICNGEEYNFNGLLLSVSGTYIDTLLSKSSCDSVVRIDLRVLGEIVDTVDAKIFEGDLYNLGTDYISKSGEYLITLPSSMGCDSLTFLKLEYFNMYIPNIFSPNQDGCNDTFAIFLEDGLVQDIRLEVFDRWGNLIYNGMEWDGRQKGKFVNPGVYVYRANILMRNGATRMVNGSMTVVD